MFRRVWHWLFSKDKAQAAANGRAARKAMRNDPRRKYLGTVDRNELGERLF